MVWLRTAVFTLLFPGTVLVYALLGLLACSPGALELPSGAIRHLGWPLIVLGVLGYCICAARFVRHGG
jgi:hypothetical protein